MVVQDASYGGASGRHSLRMYRGSKGKTTSLGSLEPP
jgi:hypothetical protein